MAKPVANYCSHCHRPAAAPSHAGCVRRHHRRLKTGRQRQAQVLEATPGTLPPTRTLVQMPKHIIEFQLPDEREELKLAQSGPLFHLALLDFYEWLRSSLKHDDTLTGERRAERQLVRERFLQILQENEVDPW